MANSGRWLVLFLLLGASVNATAEPMRCFKNFDQKMKRLESYHVAYGNKAAKGKRTSGSVRLIKKKT